jgi:hypothetical protein
MTYGKFRISGDLSPDYPADGLRGSSKVVGRDPGAILRVCGASGDTVAQPSDVGSSSRRPVINHLQIPR